jgi:hypothetical protein
LVCRSFSNQPRKFCVTNSFTPIRACPSSTPLAAEKFGQALRSSQGFPAGHANERKSIGRVCSMRTSRQDNRDQAREEALPPVVIIRLLKLINGSKRTILGKRSKVKAAKK